MGPDVVPVPLWTILECTWRARRTTDSRRPCIDGPRAADARLLPRSRLRGLNTEADISGDQSRDAARPTVSLPRAPFVLRGDRRRQSLSACLLYTSDAADD